MSRSDLSADNLSLLFIYFSLAEEEEEEEAAAAAAESLINFLRCEEASQLAIAWRVSSENNSSLNGPFSCPRAATTSLTYCKCPHPVFRILPSPPRPPSLPLLHHSSCVHWKILLRERAA